MYCVIDSFLALQKYTDAFRLVNERLPILITNTKKRELTEEEIEELDFLLESKVEILYETETFFKLLILLINHGSWLKDRVLVFGMYNISKRKVYKQLFILLLAVLLLTAIGLYSSHKGFISLMFQSYFRYTTNIALGIYFIIITIVEILSPAQRSK